MFAEDQQEFSGLVYPKFEDKVVVSLDFTALKQGQVIIF